MTASHIAATTPYPWPYDAALDPARVALVVVGAGSWTTRVPDDEVVRDRLDRLRVGLTGTGVLSVLVHHEGPMGRAHTVDRPAPTIDPIADELIVQSSGIDGFFGSALDMTLRRERRTRLIVCGYGAETCVHSTVRSANDRGYECLTVLDASLAHQTDLLTATGSSIEMSGGIFGCVGSTSDVLDGFTVQPTRSIR